MFFLFLLVRWWKIFTFVVYQPQNNIIMKLLLNALRVLAMPLLLCFALCSCNLNDEPNRDDLIIDYSPIALRIKVQNAAGEDLVNPQHPLSLVRNKVYVEIGIKRFDLENGAEKDPRSRIRRTVEVLRALPGFWWGFLYNAPAKGSHEPWHLYIGDFDGGVDAERTFRLHWGDGTTTMVKYTNKVHYKSRGKLPDVERHFYVGGQEVKPEKGYLTLVR